MPCRVVLWFPTTFHADESVSRHDSAGYSWRERRQRVALPALRPSAQNKARGRIHARSLDIISAKSDSPSNAPSSSSPVPSRFYACSNTIISQIVREVVENYSIEPPLVPTLHLSYNRLAQAVCTLSYNDLLAIPSFLCPSISL